MRISILTYLDEIFENLLYSRLYKYMRDIDLFSSNQYGFRANHSSDYALITLRIYKKNARIESPLKKSPLILGKHLMLFVMMHSLLYRGTWLFVPLRLNGELLKSGMETHTLIFIHLLEG